LYDLVSLPSISTTVLQFADDTAIITPAHPRNIKIIMTTLLLFDRSSGLKINLSKSGFLPISIPEALLPITKSLLCCQQLSTPIQYLGFPLTIRKPPRSAFLPLINNVQARCHDFANNRLSVAGRVVLTNSILNALPLHYMQTFLLPKWVTKTIQSITRIYL
jgi:hypothetical protein